MRKVSKNIEDTAEIAKVFLGELLKNKTPKEGALVVCLSGDLGAGKTAFAKAVARHLGILRKVDSPTFVIMKKYPLKSKTHKFLFHIDAYRLKNHTELLHLGWKEIISDPHNLILIEWPENVIKAIPKHHKIKISHNKAGHREFTY